MTTSSHVKDAEQPAGGGRLGRPPISVFATWVLMPIALLAMATICLWMGSVMIVRCEANPPAADDASGRTSVRVTAERWLLGLIPVWRDSRPNVVGVGSFHGTAAQLRGGDLAGILTLQLADGRTWNAPPAYAPVGTPPWKMGRQIAHFIENPSPQPLVLWCVSWMLHLAAAPLLLMGLLSAYFGVRALLVFRSAGASARGVAGRS